MRCDPLNCRSIRSYFPIKPTSVRLSIGYSLEPDDSGLEKERGPPRCAGVVVRPSVFAFLAGIPPFSTAGRDCPSGIHLRLALRAVQEEGASASASPPQVTDDNAPQPRDGRRISMSHSRNLVVFEGCCRGPPRSSPNPGRKSEAGNQKGKRAGLQHALG